MKTTYRFTCEELARLAGVSLAEGSSIVIEGVWVSGAKLRFTHPPVIVPDEELIVTFSVADQAREGVIPLDERRHV